jgi:16S rRNA (cytosine1402-N4)-methyltransferase
VGVSLETLNITDGDRVLFDLGVSYHQLTTPQRGFSFKQEGQLLMQMSPKNPILLEKLANAAKEEIIDMLRNYGDIRNARKIGTLIFESRKHLKTTLDLRQLIEKSTSKKYLKKNLHKVFQALRIWTNDELTNISKGILVAFDRLKFRGRILVISYHSGEDRIVKNIFRDLKNNRRLKLLNKKIIRPKTTEVDANPSARSARLRVGEKCVAC